MVIKINKKNVWAYLDRNKDAEYKQIYEHFSAQTLSQKGCIRSYRSRWLANESQRKLIESQIDKELLKADLQTITNEFIEFVGYIDENGVIREGAAFPPPINEKGEYLGILPHEIEGFKLIWEHLVKGVMLEWFRGGGKTYLGTWFIQFTMAKFGFPWLYLSSTAVLQDVAYWVYQWALKQNLIVKALRGGKKQTYTQFELKNGAMLRIFEYMGEEMVGQHGWYICIDDFIKKKWEDKPSDNLKAKRQWLYSISYIRRKGLLILGTRKFVDDPLEFLQNILKDKGLVVDIKTPYVMKGEYPDWGPVIDKKTGREILSVPQLYTWEELETKKHTQIEPDIDPYEAWMAEMMQDPRPRTGGMLTPEDIGFINAWGDFKNYDRLAIAVDFAWTEKKTSDYTAIEVIIKVKDDMVAELGYGFLVIRSIIKRMPVRTIRDKDGVLHTGILETIQNVFEWTRMMFPPDYVSIVVPVEMNSGGKIIVDIARRELHKFTFAQYIIEIDHRKDKVKRIEAELQHPIKNKIILFLESLNGTLLIEQLLLFPKGKHDDGPDALGMGKSVLTTAHMSTEEAEKMRKKLQEFRESKLASRYEGKVAKDLATIVQERYGKKKRSIF